MARVLLIEDDDLIATSLTRVLVQKNHVVARVDRATAGLEAIVDDGPDVVVLDLGLPDLDGLDVIKMIRGFGGVPIVVATARDDEETIVRALDLGADDYVVKPFSGRQLDARIRALLRRGGESAGSVYTIGDLVVDTGAHAATLDGQKLGLRPKEFDVLALLASRAGEVVPRKQIARQVWDDQLSASDSTIDVHLSGLRRRLGETGANPRYLRVIRGVGVMLVDPKDA